MKRIVYERDGAVIVVIPSPKAIQPGETEAAFMARLAQMHVPTGTPSVVVDATDLPDRTFRPCWEMSGNAVVVNLIKARELVIARVREERNRRLGASDADVMRAQETGPPSLLAALRQYRQALRDFPETVDLSTLGLAGLLAYVPPWPVKPGEV